MNGLATSLRALTVAFTVTGAGPAFAADPPTGAGGPRPVETELQGIADASARKASPAMAEATRKGIEEVAASGVLKTALNVGATIPAFTLPDANGVRVSSSDLLARGPLVIVFYRGAWCPYCNVYLHRWQERLPQLRERNATLVAISGESPDGSAKVAQKTEATFAVLSDVKYAVSRQFGVIYEVPRGVTEAMKTRGLDFKGYYGTETAELPLSATYVVGRDGKIVYAFLDADYRKRAEPSDVLAALDRLGQPQSTR